MENIIQSSDSLRFVTPSHEIVDIEISSWSDSLRGQKYFDQLIVTDLKYKVRCNDCTIYEYFLFRVILNLLIFVNRSYRN